MRWPFRRGDEGLGAQDPAPAPPSPAPAAPEGAAGRASEPSTAPVTPTAPTVPTWTSLPPIGPSWSAQTPLTTGPQPTRAPLSQEPQRRAPSTSAADGAPEPGRVVGLAAVVTPLPAQLVAPTELPAYFHEQPPLRHVTARPVVEHAPLTEANSDYVGEPIAPPPPAPAPSAPARAPLAQPARDAATDAGARFEEALANLHRSGLPKYLPGGALEDAPAQPPAPPVPAPAAEAGPSPSNAPLPPLTHRRNSLAESRRLGLGAPMRSAPDDAIEQAEPPSLADALAAAASTPAPPPEPPSAPPAAAPVPPAPPAAEAPPAPTAEQPVAPPAPPPPTTPRPPAASDQDGDDGGTPPTRPPLAPRPVVRPLTDLSVRPTASTTPLVFRAAPRPIEAAPAEPARPIERAVISRPPADLAQSLRSSHGVDVADVPVRRDSAAGAEARSRRARAFTREATVYLPEDAGSISSPQARGLLAHELVHAAQQRRLGTALPAANTAEGRALEHEALAAESMYSGGPSQITSSQPLRHSPPPVTANWVEDRITQLADVSAPSWEYQLNEQMQQEVAYIAQEQTYRIIDENGIGGGTGGSSSGSGFSTRTHTPSSGGSSSSGSGSSSSSRPVNSSGVEVPRDESNTNPDFVATRAADVGVGIGQATSYEEFERNWVQQWNYIRSNQGIGPITQAQLTSENRATIRGRWDEAQLEKHQEQQRAAQLNQFVAQPQRGGPGGTPGTPGAPGSTPGALVLPTGASTTGTPTTGTSPTTTSGSGSRPGGSTIPTTPQQPQAPGLGIEGEALARNAAGVGVGAFQAVSETQFKEQYLRQLNYTRANMGLAELRSLHEDPHQDSVAGALWTRAVDEKRTQMAAQQRTDSFVQSTSRSPTTPGTSTTPSTLTSAGTAVAIAASGSPAQTGHRPVASRAEQHLGPSHENENVDTDRIDVEELSTRIYDRLRSKLRAELLIDRERAGLLTDFR